MKLKPLTTDISTLSTVATKATTETTAIPTGVHSSDRRRRVRFAEQQLVHTFERVAAEEQGLVWYTSAHYKMFRQQTKWLAARLQANQQLLIDDPDSWSQTLLRVYRAFRNDTCSKQELLKILDFNNDVELDEYTLGLEELAIPAIARDFVLRRQHLLAQVQRLQQQFAADPAVQSQMIRDTSRLTSRVSRLFAGYVAQMVVQEDEKRSVTPKQIVSSRLPV